MAAGTALVTGATAGIGRGVLPAARRAGLRPHRRRARRWAPRRAGRRAERRRHGVDGSRPARRPHARRGRRSDREPRGRRRRLALLVNNAGFGTVGDLATAPPDQQEAMLRLHVLAPMRLTRAALPGMLARRRGGGRSTSRPIAAFIYAAGQRQLLRQQGVSHHLHRGAGARAGRQRRAGPGAVSGLHPHRISPADGSRRATSGRAACG